MFDGDTCMTGAILLGNLIFLLAFFTIIIVVAQEDEIIIPVLDVFQTFISWPTFNNGTILTVCLWSFRHIERILGSSVFSHFLFYNFITFLPFFILTVYLKGFIYHFSMFYFLPYSMFVYSFWEIPSVSLFYLITDKLLVSLAFLFLTIHHFPFSLFPLLSGIIGTFLWKKDVFCLQKFFLPSINVEISDDDIHISVNDLDVANDQTESNERIHNQSSNFNAGNEDSIKIITDMGFSRNQAISALSKCGNNVERAVNDLLL